MYLILALPFVFGGATLALALSRFNQSAGQVYFFDLAGASLGCLLSVLALNLLGGANAVFLVGLLGASAALLFALGANTKAWRFPSALVLVLLLVPQQQLPLAV